MNTYQIGEFSARVGASTDTLRYYEKIGLLPKIARNASGRRIYDDKDVSRLRFIRRAQRMNFTLVEISQLLEMRENPQGVRNDVRALMQTKLTEVETHLKELNTLRNEMRLLINLCRGADSGCPIIEEIDQGGSG
jgi:DNA-binding transcriptional MerR regulator